VTNPRALRVLFVCLVCIGLGQSMLFAILPPAARALGISPSRISTIFATSASIWVFLSSWWGRKSDVWGRRPVILIGLLGFGLSMALLATTIALGAAGLLSAVAVYPLLTPDRPRQPVC
jgi:MFS family permease